MLAGSMELAEGWGGWEKVTEEERVGEVSGGPALGRGGELGGRVVGWRGNPAGGA